jgi:hypothetical protein
LNRGDTFLFNGILYQAIGLRRTASVNTPHRPASFFVATDLKSGKGERFSIYTKVEPVGIEITVVRK